jgi:carboxypeptidase C (cathepsin A)
MASSAANEKDLEEIYVRVAKYTGLPESTVAQHGGRIPLSVFVKEQRRTDKLLLSGYDGSTAAPDPYPNSSRTEGDPVFDGLRTIFTSTMADYLSEKLGVRTELPYRLVNGEATRQWNWWGGLYGHGGYPGSGDQLREALAASRSLKVVIAHGMTDLVTPYFATKYVIEHLPPTVLADRVTLNLYAGGHMMYTRAASRARLHADAGKMYPPPGK